MASQIVLAAAQAPQPVQLVLTQRSSAPSHHDAWRAAAATRERNAARARIVCRASKSMCVCNVVVVVVVVVERERVPAGA